MLMMKIPMDPNFEPIRYIAMIRPKFNFALNQAQQVISHTFQLTNNQKMWYFRGTRNFLFIYFYFVLKKCHNSEIFLVFFSFYKKKGKTIQPNLHAVSN
jgi:hypothetical protein